MTMKFEDLPKSVRAQLHDDLLHEEPGQRAAAEQEVARLQAEVEARELAAETPEQAQERFDRAQAEAAGVPLGFAQLYSKVEAELHGMTPTDSESVGMTAAVVVQLVANYCAAETEPKIKELGRRYEAALTGLREIMLDGNIAQLVVDDEAVARSKHEKPSIVCDPVPMMRRTRFFIEQASE
ncbi:hypothetical protein FDH48_gp42 [Arthrobacter phage Jawnski]|uniref:Uncharacterized protein n=1 Tax=Arthrobacter phage Jawnski TaxID=1772327 RepID=A0A0U4JRZ6_9CAUD|nr:hypothetical protein FDH48_gp42 [Arthrobacter phage Jawnski]ALY09371.1 hypothetical protein JAWNSKI_42 [Arthrobacter phage Jawnski]